VDPTLGGAVMSEMTQDEALRLAEALVGQAIKETEVRCSVLAQFIDECERARARTSAWNEAIRELRGLHDYRGALLRRRDLIQEALDCLVGDIPTKAALTPPPPQAARRVQQQVQIQRRV
jgi:hypothetical protein